MKRAPKKSSAKKKPSVKKTIKEKPDAASGLRELLVAELKDIYWAENALLKAIPKMIKNATASELSDALSNHLEETKQHVVRLEDVFNELNEKPVAKKCEAMSGLIKEAEEIMKESEKGAVRDAGIILAGQKVEHYEIATYGTLLAFAKLLEEPEVENLLKETLEEEKGADEKLSEIAEYSINIKAMSEESVEA